MLPTLFLALAFTQAAAIPDIASPTANAKTKVTAPVVLFTPEPEIPRHLKVPVPLSPAKVTVLVYCKINTKGKTTSVRVLKSENEELNASATRAVKAYRFQPAMEDGHPVEVEMSISVEFRTFQPQ